MRWKYGQQELVWWGLAGLAAAVVCAWAYPRAFPLQPADWRLHRGEAVELALATLRDLGETVEDPYVVAGLWIAPAFEHRLLTSGLAPAAVLRDSEPGRRIVRWRVLVYPPGGGRECDYLVDVTPAGEVVTLWIRPPEELEGEVETAAARERAGELLRRLGFAAERLGEPEPRRIEKPGRTDVVLRYPDAEAVLGAELPYGVEVTFAGDSLAAVELWLEDPETETFPGPWPQGLLPQLRGLAPFLLLPLLAAPFLRRYHEGQAGVRRGLAVFALVLASGTLAFIPGIHWVAVQQWTEDASVRQLAWLAGLMALLVLVAPLALAAALAWSGGEPRWRRRGGARLAAFDAVLRGRFASVTVARAALRGPAAGLVLAAALLAALPAADLLGARPLYAWLFDRPPAGSAWPALSQLAVALLCGPWLVLALFALLPAAVRRLGRIGGGTALALLAGVLFFPPIVTYPLGSEVLLTASVAAALMLLLAAYDLLTAVLAAVTVYLVPVCLPWLFADDAFLHLQAALALAALALPLVLSARGLFSGDEVVYRWRDVPLHARRIAGRERRRMEIETARAVQRSILPRLPERLAGVELAHAYLPASEVGGDFYDVRALDDGRLALAVGDVAGHGVGSGLVMAMARSALAVQMGSDPEVKAVFRALNRTLHQTARRSLTATLCYGLLDPGRRELVFGSAGHLCPYLVRTGDGVHPLESPAYPLGVRHELEIRPRSVRLATGDVLFLCSDGVVEALRGGSDEPFGFERLEASLERHANGSPGALRDRVLADLERFTGPGTPDDDRTILVLRLPPPNAPGVAAEGGSR